VHEPQENAWHADGLAAVAGVDFTAMHKGVVQDWQPYNPFDPTQGHVGPHPAVVELDVAGEYWGLSELPFCAPGFFRHLLRHAGENGAVGSVTRVQRGSASALGTPNEVNLRAVNAFLKDPDTSLGAIWEAELGARYGLTRSSAGFARIKRTLQDTFEIRLKSHYVLGIWALDKGSDLPDSAALGELDGRGKMPKWDADWQERWDRLDRPDRAVVLDVWQEAGEAVALADEGLLAIKTLSGVLPDEPWNDLHRRLKHQYAAARAWRAVKLFVWAQRAQKLHPEDADLSAWMAWAHLELGGIRDRMIADGLTDVRVASPARIDEFLGNTASLLSPVVGAQRPPAAPFLPLRAFPQRTPEAADLVLGATRPIRASLDTGTEIPDYGTVVVLDGLGPDERTRVALDHLSPSSRHVLRLRAIVDGVEVHGGDTWLFTPAACACTADDLCLDGQCVPRDTCVPDCYGRCPGDEDGCGGVCLQNECTGCCAGVLCLEDPTGEFCP